MSDLLQKKMTRKQFLVYLGLILLSVSGISGLLKRLSHPASLGLSDVKVTGGFGNGPYGGRSKS